VAGLISTDDRMQTKGQLLFHPILAVIGILLISSITIPERLSHLDVRAILGKINWGGVISFAGLAIVFGIAMLKDSFKDSVRDQLTSLNNARSEYNAQLRSDQILQAIRAPSSAPSDSGLITPTSIAEIFKRSKARLDAVRPYLPRAEKTDQIYKNVQEQIDYLYRLAKDSKLPGGEAVKPIAPLDEFYQEIIAEEEELFKQLDAQIKKKEHDLKRANRGCIALFVAGFIVGIIGQAIGVKTP
jgi:hypothetical protein